MITARMRAAVVVAALVCGAAAVAVLVPSDHQDAKIVWATSGLAAAWSFIGIGLYAAQRRPESRIGVLMVALGFAWCLAALSASDAPLLYTLGQIVGGLWGGVFLQLLLSFPSGRLASRIDRALVLAGYLLFTVGAVPALLVAGPSDLGCDDCPENVLLIRRSPDLADVAFGLQAGLYAALFGIVIVRLALRWKRTPPLERLQLTPVYGCGLITFALVTAGTAGAGDAAWWLAYVAMALLPFAFLAGLLRSHVARLDAELRARLEELRASRARIVEAGDAERRRLERDLHDGAQARLVALAMLLNRLDGRIGSDPDAAALLGQAQDELKLSLAELRELARGIHPPLLAEQGLAPALDALAARAPVPVTIEADRTQRLPRAVEIAAYFVVSESLANVAKYARATAATVTIQRVNGRLVVDVGDDGIGGADTAGGSGLRGLADRVAALDGTLTLDSPDGAGTRVRAEIPLAG